MADYVSDIGTTTAGNTTTITPATSEAWMLSIWSNTTTGSIVVERGEAAIQYPWQSGSGSSAIDLKFMVTDAVPLKIKCVTTDIKWSYAGIKL